MPGRVVRLHLKPREGRARGIPKRAVPHLVIDEQGARGDFNRWRTEKANGDPDQAILLLSEEVLADLRAEGWPVEPGELGENLTIVGLQSSALEPGSRIRIGEAVLEISKPCDPCTVLYSLPYVGVDRGAAFLRALSGRRGWFARVIRGGTVRVGMPIEPIGSLDRV